MSLHYVTILGAARSGTNILRDCLTRLPGFRTWPCDEINYIWRHGNAWYPSDEFTPDMARSQVRRYIRKQFEWVVRRYQAEVVVEKTCANSLRVEFVDRVVPEARYIFIHRNGFDVVASALKRWQAGLDLGYAAQKARFIPLMDMPYYALCHLWNRMYRLSKRQKRLAFWGPRLDHLEEMQRKHSLEELCALQWKRCVDRSSEALSSLDPSRWLEVAYEDFVQFPGQELERIVSLVDWTPKGSEREKAVAGVLKTSLGKGHKELPQSVMQQIEPIMQDTLSRYNYV
jgi:hypothetical protein